MIHLSEVYAGLTLWALVYHTQPGSQEVELITHRLFKSKKKAWKWFLRKRKEADFIEPEAVEVSHLNRLVLTTTRHILPKEDIYE